MPRGVRTEVPPKWSVRSTLPGDPETERSTAADADPSPTVSRDRTVGTPGRLPYAEVCQSSPRCGRRVETVSRRPVRHRRSFAGGNADHASLADLWGVSGAAEVFTNRDDRRVIRDRTDREGLRDDALTRGEPRIGGGRAIEALGRQHRPRPMDPRVSAASTARPDCGIRR